MGSRVTLEEARTLYEQGEYFAIDLDQCDNDQDKAEALLLSIKATIRLMPKADDDDQALINKMISESIYLLVDCFSRTNSLEQFAQAEREIFMLVQEQLVIHFGTLCNQAIRALEEYDGETALQTIIDKWKKAIHLEVFYMQFLFQLSGLMNPTEQCAQTWGMTLDEANERIKKLIGSMKRPKSKTKSKISKISEDTAKTCLKIAKNFMGKCDPWNRDATLFFLDKALNAFTFSEMAINNAISELKDKKPLHLLNTKADILKTQINASFLVGQERIFLLNGDGRATTEKKLKQVNKEIRELEKLEKEERIAKYWKSHAAEKEKLENEKSKLIKK